MSAVGQAIRLLREQRGWTQTELAEQLGITQSTLSAWERGAVSVKPPERKRIAAAFELSLDQFDETWRASRVERTQGGPGIPVINRAPAGLVSNYEEYGCDSGQGFEYLDWGDVHDDLAFAVIVVGDSMEPTLFDGDYVIFAPTKVPRPRVVLEDGKVVFVRFTQESPRQGSCTLARFYKQKDGSITLAKDNPAHRPLLVHREEVESISVALEKRSKRL